MRKQHCKREDYNNGKKELGHKSKEVKSDVGEPRMTIHVNVKVSPSMLHPNTGLGSCGVNVKHPRQGPNQGRSSKKSIEGTKKHAAKEIKSKYHNKHWSQRYFQFQPHPGHHFLTLNMD